MRAGCVFLICAAVFLMPGPPSFAGSRTDELLERTGRLVELFWEQVPSYNCRELVTREKIAKKGKVEYRQELEFDYLALTDMKNDNLAVNELRVPLKKDIEKSDPPPLLETNGFPTLQLIFHPRYQASYRYIIEEEDINRGSVRIRFEHRRGAGSTSAVMVQGKAYALELQGTAWIDNESGAIQRITASLIGPMNDINVERFAAEVTYEHLHFPSESESRWLPSKAMIELQTGLQHWRNNHVYSQYKRFTVQTEEAMAK